LDSILIVCRRQTRLPGKQQPHHSFSGSTEVVDVLAMKLRFYLDTSVISVRYDPRSPERRTLTEEFFGRTPLSNLCTSEVALAEIDPTPDADQRRSMLELLGGIEVFPLTEEMKGVGEEYVLAGIFPRRMMRDAYHVAAASVAGVPVLVSWNFKHLVNRRRRAAVLDVNARLDLPALEIIAPPEV